MRLKLWETQVLRARDGPGDRCLQSWTPRSLSCSAHGPRALPTKLSEEGPAGSSPVQCGWSPAPQKASASSPACPPLPWGISTSLGPIKRERSPQHPRDSWHLPFVHTTRLDKWAMHCVAVYSRNITTACSHIFLKKPRLRFGKQWRIANDFEPLCPFLVVSR